MGDSVTTVRGREDLIYTATVKAEYNLSYKLIREHLSPAKLVRNPHHKSTLARLYRVADVLEVMQKAEVQDALSQKEARKAKRGENPIDYAARFERAFHRSPLGFIGLVFNNLFNLNRYAKYHRCKSTESIYELKDSVLKVLVLSSYLVSVENHTQTLPPKICYRCNGTGYDWDEDDGCYHCGGTGIYMGEKTLYFDCFYFCCKESKYSFHSPKGHVVFPPEKYVDGATEIPIMGEKPLTIGRTSIALAKKRLAFFAENGERLLRQCGAWMKGEVA